jgi:cell division protein FtsN
VNWITSHDQPDPRRRIASAPLAAFAFAAVIAVLVGFQGASMLVTVTQLGATPPKAPAPKSHASLVPRTPAVPVKPEEPMPAPKPSERASEPAPAPAPRASTQASAEIVTDNQAGIAAAAKARAQAEMDAMEQEPDERVPRREQRRRYRAPPVDKHRVY